MVEKLIKNYARNTYIIKKEINDLALDKMTLYLHIYIFFLFYTKKIGINNTFLISGAQLQRVFFDIFYDIKNENKIFTYKINLT